MAAEAFDTQMLIKLESARILPAALPTRMWTGLGPILLDVGDGYGAVQWNGTTFGDIETAGIVNIEKTADGVPKRLSVAVGVDDTRADARAAVTQADLGPLTATLLFVVRETAGPSLPPLSPARSNGSLIWRQVPKDANLDEENTFRYLGGDVFELLVRPFHREAISDIAVPGNRIGIIPPTGQSAADMEIFYASWAASAAPNLTGLDIWTIQTDGHGSIAEDTRDGGYELTLSDPFKDQDWRFVQDGNGAPLVIRGRTGEMAYDEGLWTFEIENRVHDADRLLVDVWSDAVQQARYSGDLFFEFTGEIEAGLDFSWPN